MRCSGLILLCIIMVFAKGAHAGNTSPVELSTSPVPGVAAERADDIGISSSRASGDSVQVLSGYDRKDGGGFVYVEEMENPGTRSAGIRGQLTFNGFRLQGYQGRRLRTPIGSFHYIQSDSLWEPQGWFPMAEIPIKEVDAPIDIVALASGSYQGALRIGTPSDWCYDPGGDTWYDPERLVSTPPSSR